MTFPSLQSSSSDYHEFKLKTTQYLPLYSHFDLDDGSSDDVQGRRTNHLQPFGPTTTPDRHRLPKGLAMTGRLGIRSGALCNFGWAALSPQTHLASTDKPLLGRCDVSSYHDECWSRLQIRPLQALTCRLHSIFVTPCRCGTVDATQ